MQQRIVFAIAVHRRASHDPEAVPEIKSKRRHILFIDIQTHGTEIVHSKLKQALAYSLSAKVRINKKHFDIAVCHTGKSGKSTVFHMISPKGHLSEIERKTLLIIFIVLMGKKIMRKGLSYS